MYNSQWFENLNKPFLNPPSSVFAPVWTVLYIMIALSFFMFIKGGITKDKIIPLICFFVQLILNFGWSPAFFGMQNIALALVICGFMWVFTLVTIILFAFHSKIAAILLIPYLLWISFAFYLNFAYLVLN